MSEFHEGGCVCGKTRYRVRGEPQRVSACSCRWCQTRTGSALGISVYFLKEDVEFIQDMRGRYRLTSDAGPLDRAGILQELRDRADVDA